MKGSHQACFICLIKAAVRSFKATWLEALSTGQQNGRWWPKCIGLFKSKARSSRWNSISDVDIFSATSKWDYDWWISHPHRSRHISRCAFCSFFFFLLQEANSTEAGIKQWNIHRNVSGAASEKDLFVLLGCGVLSDWMLAKLSVLWNKFPNLLGPELCSVWDGKEITFNRKLIAKI